MALDLVQLFPNLLDRLVWVKQMSLLSAFRRELVIVLEVADVVVWIRPEQQPENLRVGGRAACPGVPEFFAQGIDDEVVLRALEDVVRAGVWWL